MVSELAGVAAAGGVGTLITWGDGDLEARMAKASDRFANADTASDDVCLLAFTSGTTGQPKACVHFHRDVLAMADVVARHLLKTSPNDVYAGSPPLGFTFGLGALLVFPLRFRAATVPIEAPAPAAVLAAIERHRITCLFTAPFAYRALAAELAGRDLSSLKRCVSAGEFLPKSVSETWFDKTGIRIIDGIGATEMIHIFVSASGEDIRPGSTGKPLPGYKACVLDEDGEPMLPGATGRLAVTGPTGCRYLDDERQRDYVQNGWNVTGDIYRLDEEGYFWFVARADDMIVSAGYNIAGPEVEWALLAHPAVRECAVVGTSDPRARHDRESLRGARARACGGYRARQRAPGFREAAHRAVQVPAGHRVPRGPAEDRHRQAAAQGAPGHLGNNGGARPLRKPCGGSRSAAYIVDS